MRRSDIGRRVRASIPFLLIALMVLLRALWLDRDAYAGLTWNSELVTDEAFYCHDARNLLLTGSSAVAGDDFHNALIMPLLHAVQVAVFRAFGFSLLHSRCISVVLSLGTLALFFAACRRAFGRRVAWVGLLLLGLDHISLLYHRMALMDAPGQLPLVACFYAFIRAQENTGAAQRAYISYIWLASSGLALAAAYATRGLSLLLLPAPVYLCWKRPRSSGAPALKWASACGQQLSTLHFLLGMGAGLALYIAFWYLPHRAQLQAANHFYIFQQLMPRSLDAVRHNIGHSLFGNDRGFSAYLFRHSPVQWAIALAWLLTWRLRSRQQNTHETEAAQTPTEALNSPPAQFLALWLLLMLLFCGLSRYAPPRYYVLFYPALAGLAGLAIVHVRATLAALWAMPYARTLWGTFLAYHLAEALLRHASLAADLALYGFTLLAAVLLWRWPALRKREYSPAEALGALPYGGKPIHWTVCALGLWAIVNTGWMLHWATHQTDTQREADEWLGRSLPANAVLIGDAAPGLTLRNHRAAINVIPGLCNDVRPLEAFADRPRYVILFESPTPMRWWQARYPRWITPAHRMRRFVLLGKFRLALYDCSEVTAKRP